MKTLLTSKTFWANTLALLLILIPAVQQWIIANAIEAGGLLAALNVILKIITAVHAHFSTDSTKSNTSRGGEETDSLSPRSGHILVGYMYAIAISGLLWAIIILAGIMLTSCSAPASLRAEWGGYTIHGGIMPAK